LSQITVGQFSDVKYNVQNSSYDVALIALNSTYWTTYGNNELAL